MDRASEKRRAPEGRAARHDAGVLLDQRLLSLDEAPYSKFLDALDNPPAPSTQLKSLLAEKATWER